MTTGEEIYCCATKDYTIGSKNLVTRGKWYKLMFNDMDLKNSAPERKERFRKNKEFIDSELKIKSESRLKGLSYRY